MQDPMKRQTSRLAMAGVFAAMITLMTAYICHIPYGTNGGYVHVGDALIYLAAVLLPRPYALGAALVGAGLADVLTAPLWLPVTLVVKALLVLPFTSGEERILCRRNLLAPLFGVAITTGGYYLGEALLFGSFLVPLASLPGSLIQSGGSALFFYLLAHGLDRAHLKEKLL